MLTRRNGKRLKECKAERLLDGGNLPGNGALFQTIFEKAALGIVVTNPSGRILQSNPFFQQLLGYSSEEIIGRDSQQFTHADDAATERALFLTAMEDGQEAVHLKKRYLHKDGHPIWADLTATICRDAEGKPDFVISVVKGITEKVGPEEAMRESELRFKTLAEASFEGIVLSERGLIVDLNDQQARMHGYDRSELIGRPVLEIVAPESRGSVLEVIRSGKQGPFESLDRRKDGTMFPVEVRVRVIQANGRQLHIAAIRDITERKRAEETLRESEERLREAQALGQIGNWEFDIDNQKITWSDQVYRLYERDPALGPPTVEEEAAYYAPEQVERLHEYARRAVEEGKEFTYDLHAHLPSGTFAYFSATMRPVKDESGRVNRLVGTVQNITERKRIEERYRTIVRTALDGFWLLDMQGRFLDVNDAYCNLIGYSREELLTMGIPDIEAVEKPGETATRIRNIMKVGGDRFQTHHKCKDGRVVDVEVSVNYMRDEERMFVFLRDITERKRAEEALRESEERYRKLVETAPDLIYSLSGENGTIMTLNPALEELTGWSPDECLGKPFKPFIHPDDLPLAIESYQKVLRGETPRPHELRILKKSGGYLAAEFVVTPLMKDGKVIGELGIARNITERKRTEEALRESERKYRDLINGMNDAVWVIDFDTTILDVNSAATRILGYTREELLSLKIPDIDDSLAPEQIQDLARNMPRDKIQVFETCHTTKDGRKLPVEVSSSLVSYGGKTAILSIARGITDRKRAEEAIQQERNLLRTVIDNLPDVIYVKDAACRKTVVNRADLRNMGCQSEAEALGKTDFDLYPREVAEAFYADDQSVIQSGQPVINREEYLFDAEGQKHWLLTTKVPLRDQKGQIIGLVGIGRDITNRVQATEQLRESQQMLQTVLDTIPARVFWKDRESRYLGCNSSFARDAGFNKPEELVGRDDFQFSWRDQASLYRADDLQVITTGVPKLNYEERQTIADGQCAWVRTSKIPLRNPKGEITGVLGTYEDITEHKQTEEALHHERNLLRTLIDNLPDAIYVKDADCRKTVVNQADLRNMGCQSEADALGKTDFSLYPPEVAETFYADDLSVLEAGQAVVNREEFFFDPEGRKRWLLTSKLPLKDQNGRIIGLVGIGHDITERKRTEEALTKLWSAVEQAVDGVIITTKAGIIEYVNPAWEKMTAFSKEDTVGKTPRILKSGKQGDSFYRAMWKTISDGEVWKGSLINKKKNGELFHAEVSIAPIFDESHNITHFVAIERDVTEHRQLEQQLIQALRMEGLGTLAGGVAHDFNNLLGIILGHATLLDERRQDPAKFSRSVDAISTAVQRGAGLVRQLLTFARKTEAVLELVNANETVEELVQMVRETFPRTIEFSLDLSPDLPSIPADRNQLYQALLNLCVNSRDAMPTVGTISIKTDTIPRSKLQAKHANAIEEKYVRIRVSDTGKGMDETTRSRIFEPFFTTKERGKGTGLGLSVVYGVVDSHNGFIDVESEVGHGTTFNLYFPILPLRVESSPPQQQEPKEVVGGVETVLVVEDEEMLLDSVIQVLEQKGYRVLTAKDGTEGLEVYSRHRDDVAVVLMDMGLPKLGGWEVFQKMKAVNPRVKVVLASGYLDPYVKSEMLKAGAKDFIQKPYVPEQILSRVRRVIDGK